MVHPSANVMFSSLFIEIGGPSKRVGGPEPYVPPVSALEKSNYIATSNSFTFFSVDQLPVSYAEEENLKIVRCIFIQAACKKG